MLGLLGFSIRSTETLFPQTPSQSSRLDVNMNIVEDDVSLLKLASAAVLKLKKRLRQITIWVICFWLKSYLELCS